jgi:hypothetical protein
MRKPIILGICLFGALATSSCHENKRTLYKTYWQKGTDHRPDLPTRLFVVDAGVCRLQWVSLNPVRREELDEKCERRPGGLMVDGPFGQPLYFQYMGEKNLLFKGQVYEPSVSDTANM